MSNVIKVSTLVSYLKRSIENDMHLKSIMVSGEISNFTHHRSGHLYFSLKDNNAKMNCVMFKTNASRLKITLKEGMKVIVTCSVSIYEPQGSVQLFVNHIQSDGIGDLYLAFEALKKKLLDEGLFAMEHKKPLPSYPLDIAIVSAKTGAAIQDVYAIIRRRWPIAKLTLYQSLVQGDNAAIDLIHNIKLADQQHHELILLVRGGGSIEDLWCFNDEALSRTIYDAHTCIVSGVGHEIDTTLVDYVSDARAPTPSAAAELVTPNIQDVATHLDNQYGILQRQMKTKLEDERTQLAYYQGKSFFHDATFLLKSARMQLTMNLHRLQGNQAYFQKQQYQINEIKNALKQSIQKIIHDDSNELIHRISLLDAFSPLQILKRGYSITSDSNGHIIRKIDDIVGVDTIKIRLQDGRIDAKIIGEEKYGTK